MMGERDPQKQPDQNSSIDNRCTSILLVDEMAVRLTCDRAIRREHPDGNGREL